MKIPLKTAIAAKALLCPFFLNPEGFPLSCAEERCMAWTIVQKETSREDHSGGKEYIRRLANLYGVEPTREGPHGSTGYWVIPELGYCKRLWPMADHPTVVDY